MSSAELQANGFSFGWLAISGNGRYVVFNSSAWNLVPGDEQYGPEQLFLRDRRAGTTEWVSLSSAGEPANSSASFPALSRSGRFLAFESWGDNLVPDDTNFSPDVFLRDLRTGQTRRISVTADGQDETGNSGSPDISANGRFVTFTSWAQLDPADVDDQPDVYLYDRIRDTLALTTFAEPARGDFTGAISGNGRVVTYDSTATDNIRGDTNGEVDVFARVLATGAVDRVSVGPGGVQGDDYSAASYGGVSRTGRYVAFYTEATNFVSGDQNGAADVFVRDRLRGTTELVSAAVGGGVGNATSASSPRISSNGRFVVFDSEASNLVRGDTNGVTDTFVRDLVANTTRRVSTGARGAQGNAYSGFSVMSRDGRHVAFLSEASNLVRRDTNDVVDVFARTRW